ncbi:DUF6088 family protein [Pseudomonas aeruginosa]|uniref:DUF6088 family protein n=1 Tax=Pseudomonas aeruginosa TaxID=287 RepID=UPI000DEFA452|nr:DUF6088 family protein [Pseudomonas aeruginosa]MCO1759685.1 hypothetical protein [Pseudomonas aeruginosa]MCS7936211.1 DUF6088 family protein [Pseudomonas aeruginosa]MCV4034358.1 DUF6088 family protein [Pseudomonas aeruginosa]
MPSVHQAILERSRSLAEGEILAPKEFLHLGSRAAVDQALCRLVKAKQLTRLGRGLYVSPKQVQARCTPTLARSLCAQGKQRIVSCGAQAAVTLGLSEHQSAQEELLTSGRSRTLLLGQTTVRLNHAPYWMLALGDSPAGEAVRAMAWLGEGKANIAASALHQRLPPEEWNTIALARSSLPSWMAAAIGRAATK